jgi:hypothetical protein
MTIGFLFWLLWVLAFLFGFWGVWPNANRPTFVPYGGIVLIFLLLFLLGWRTFGFVIQG